MNPRTTLFTPFLLLTILAPLCLPLAPVSHATRPGVLHLSYVVEVYDPATNKTGFFIFYSPALISLMNLSEDARKLLSTPEWDFITKRVTVNISIDYTNNVVNFTIVIGPGFIAKLKTIKAASKGIVSYAITRIENISYRSIYAVIKHSYRFDPRTYTLFSLDRKWEGTTPYLAPVDPNRPIFHVIYLDPVPTVCLFTYSDRLRSFLLQLSRAAGINNLTLIRVNPGESLTIRLGDNRTTEISANGPPVLAVKECSSLSIYGVVIDPRAEAKPYHYGGVFVPADEAVYFSSELVRKNLDVVKRIARGITRVGDGVAMAIGNITSSYELDFFIAVNSRVLPPSVLKRVSLMLMGKPAGVILSTSIIYSSTVLANIRGEYHLSGYLLWAETNSYSTAPYLIMPVLDMVNSYLEWGGNVYYNFINASTVRVNLVAISGSRSLPPIQASPTRGSALFVSIWLGVFLFSVSAFMAARRTRRLRVRAGEGIG